MNLGLAGQNAVVIGGTRGIGRAIALGLAEEGVNVGICARGEEALRAAEAEIGAKRVRAFAGPCDAGEPAALTGFLDEAREALGGVDILVHNASALATGPGLADWEAGLKVDLMGAVHATEHVMPWMEEAGGGSILFVSSISGLEADPSMGFGYAAVKAALIAYAKKLAVMHAPRGIRVNAIAPGFIDTDMTRSLNEDQREALMKDIPLQRLGTPADIAAAPSGQRRGDASRESGRVLLRASRWPVERRWRRGRRWRRRLRRPTPLATGSRRPRRPIRPAC